MDFVFATLEALKGADDMVLLAIAGSGVALCVGAVALMALHGRDKAGAGKADTKAKLPKVALPMVGGDDKPGGRLGRKARAEDPFLTRLDQLA